MAVLAAVAVQAVAAAVQLGAVVQGAAGPLQPEVAEEAVAGLWAAAAVVGLRLVRAEAAVVDLRLAARAEAAAVVGLQLAARPDAGRLAWADDPVERQAAPLSDA